MRLRAKKSDLRSAQHEGAPGAAQGRASLARRHEAALAAVKRELAAILLVAAVGGPLVVLWLDGLRELAVLAGYGLGGALWVHVRARGLVHAAVRARQGDGDGA